MEYVLVIISALLVNNVVFAQFLGICPFLGVSQKISSAVGMGVAVTFVMTITPICTYLCYAFILKPLGIEYMQIIVYILIIASLVQMVEIILKKISPPLYSAMGIFLPLMSTNCGILGVALIIIQKDYLFVKSVIFSAATGLGFALAMVIFAGLREQLEYAAIPKAMRGVPVLLVTAGLLAMAFMGFAGIVSS